MLDKALQTKIIGTLAAITSISGSFFIAPSVVRADNSQYIYEVGEQLIRSAIASGLSGYTLAYEPVVNTLYQGRSGYININLRAGKSYGIVGVCERDKFSFTSIF